MSISLMAQMSIVTSKQKKAASHREWTSAEKRTVKFPRDAGNEDELPMQPGETIALINYYSELEFEEDGDSLPDWCFGRKKSGSSGYFYLPFTEEATEESQTVYTESSNTSASYKKALMKFNTSQLHRVVFKEVPYYSTEKPADDLECIICKNLTDDPHQTDCCGHSMCYNCGTKWQKKRNSCPHCRHSPFSIVKDARTKRLIAGLTMRCKYYTKGCAWIGGINELSSHLDSDCHFETTECLQCSMQLVRQDLQVHTETACKERIVSCPCCSDDYTYDELVTEHYEECPDWPMRCPNKCGPQDNLTRASLQAHLDEDCPEQLISCQFSEAGCGLRVRRREMEKHVHNSVGQHMADMMRDYIKLKEEMSQSKENHRIVTEELAQCKEDCSAVKEELAQCKKDYRIVTGELSQCNSDWGDVKEESGKEEPVSGKETEPDSWKDAACCTTEEIPQCNVGVRCTIDYSSEVIELEKPPACEPPFHQELHPYDVPSICNRSESLSPVVVKQDMHMGTSQRQGNQWASESVSKCDQSAAVASGSKYTTNSTPGTNTTYEGGYGVKKPQYMHGQLRVEEKRSKKLEERSECGTVSRSGAKATASSTSSYTKSTWNSGQKRTRHSIPRRLRPYRVNIKAARHG